MKKGQGAKDRSTYLEARHGHAASGVVGFYIQLQKQRELLESTVRGLGGIKKPSPANESALARFKKDLEKANDDIAHFGQHVQKEAPKFWSNLAKALSQETPVYPEDVRMLDAYYAMKYQDYEEGEGKDVSYQALFIATQDARTGNPNASTFNRMVKRYGLKLVKGKGGRKRMTAGGR